MTRLILACKAIAERGGKQGLKSAFLFPHDQVRRSRHALSNLPSLLVPATQANLI